MVQKIYIIWYVTGKENQRLHQTRNNEGRWYDRLALHQWDIVRILNHFFNTHTHILLYHKHLAKCFYKTTTGSSSSRWCFIHLLATIKASMQKTEFLLKFWYERNRSGEVFVSHLRVSCYTVSCFVQGIIDEGIWLYDSV